MTKPDISSMTPEEFAELLRQRRDALFNIPAEAKGKNNRSYINRNNGELFVSSSVKLAMQRRRTK